MTTITITPAPLIGRGDNLEYEFTSPPSRTRWRVLRVEGETLTVRAHHRSRLVEWLHAHYEDWLAWPLADLRACVSAR